MAERRLCGRGCAVSAVAAADHILDRLDDLCARCVVGQGSNTVAQGFERYCLHLPCVQHHIPAFYYQHRRKAWVAEAQAICMQTQDFRRAFEAFVAKRTPVFEGN